MYVGTFLDKKNNKLWVSERIKGQRLTTEYPLMLEYYIADENGYYNGLDGKKLKKVSYRNSFEQYQLKQQFEENHIQTYELNFNLINKVLYKYYNGAKSPELHKSFFDIEVDRKGYEYLTVDQLIEKACCPINAISIYNNWQNTLFTLMLKPETLSKEQALEVCKKFENTFLFDDEKGLLEALIELFKDSDLLCGWNSCLEKNTPIWLKNRIIPFYKINEGDKLCDSIVQKKSNINLKDEYCITLYNGMKIYTSKDHIFPNIEYDNEKYVYNKNMGRNIKDNNVEYLINTIKDKTLFLKLKKHINENKSITYRDYILMCLDYILKYYDICFSNMDIKIDWNKSRAKQKCYSRIKDKITKEDIVKYIKENDSLKIFNKGFSGNFEIDLNEIINDDYMHILGLIYTDGSKWKNTISFYNSNISVIDKITMFTDEIKQVDKEKTNPYYNYKGVMRRRFSINNKLGFLIGMIYNNDNKKSLNKEILSLCSEQQFFSFFSGCIDGDGWIGKNNVGYCNYDNNILDVQELLLWNGIFSSTHQYDKHLAIPAYLNSLMKEKLNLWVDYKVEKLKNLKNVSRKNSKAKARLTYYREYEDNIYVQIKSIKSTNRKVEMYDIMTDTHYFYANGVKTHNCRFDIPYIIRRLNNALGKKSANRLNVWDVEPKEKSAKDDFGSSHIEYELYGKWNVDYLVLYKKHERGKKESYKLDSIAEIELGENKVQHNESLEDMYRQRYEDFIKYNRQDTMLVKRLEDKLKYIDIHNRQCHSICCTYDATLGTVAWVDQAIINEAHESNIIVPDRLEGKNKEFDGIVPPGAYVPEPVPGLHSYIMSYDMASLYPNTTIALNMSTETIIGQVRLTKTIPYLWKKIEDNDLYSNKGKKIPKWGDAWLNEWGTLEFIDILNQNDEKLILDIEGGGSVEMTAKQIHDMVFAENSNLNISAFGTIFRTDKEGLVSRMFKRWYSERKGFKKKMEHFEDLEAGFEIKDENILNSLKGFTNPNKSDSPIEYDLSSIELYVKENKIDKLKQYMLDNDLELSDDNRIISKHRKYFNEQVNYWDLEQYVKKICLNSSYGAILNNGSTFFDFRFGSSITMSGRKVWQHLASKTNEVMAGEYIHRGNCIVTGDTDSCYMSMNEAFKKTHPNFDFSIDNVIQYADKIGKEVNGTFPDYMIKTFHCTPEGAAREGSEREVVASRGLICGKKRYALLVIDKDGYRQDVDGKPGKMKIMGIQVARSDTPKLVRKLLKDMLQSILVDGSKEKLYEILKEFGKTKWSQLEPWEKGRPKACNKLKFYTDEYNKTGKCSVGQVMASINWNKLIDANNDKISPKVLDGDKVIVCSLNPNNAYGMKSIAYPLDLNILPEWFKELPFSEQDMEDSIIDTTLDTIFKAVNWKLRLSDAMRTNDDINDFITFLD